MQENFKLDKWDVDGRYKKIARALVAQCAGENLNVEEAGFVLGIASGEINRQGRCVLVTSEDTAHCSCKDAHTL